MRPGAMTTPEPPTSCTGSSFHGRMALRGSNLQEKFTTELRKAAVIALSLASVLAFSAVGGVACVAVCGVDSAVTK